jgi:hypothetical protein
LTLSAIAAFAGLSRRPEAILHARASALAETQRLIPAAVAELPKFAVHIVRE